MCGSSPSSRAISQHCGDVARWCWRGRARRGSAGRRDRRAPACRRGTSAPRCSRGARPRRLQPRTSSGSIVQASGASGIVPEGAVRAAVEAQVGDRQEDLGRVGDDAALAPRAHVRRRRRAAAASGSAAAPRRCSACASSIGSPPRARSRAARAGGVDGAELPGGNVGLVTCVHRRAAGVASAVVIGRRRASQVRPRVKAASAADARRAAACAR